MARDAAQRRKGSVTLARDGFRWEPRTATRLGLSTALVSATAGILFAALQAQGWKMPKLAGMGLVVLAGAVIVAAAALFVYEVIRALRLFLEHRETTSSWVESEPPGLLDYEPDAERAMTRFTEELVKLGKRTERLSRKFVRHGRRIERAANRSARGKRRIANRPAKHMSRNAGYIEKRAELFKALVRDISRNYEGLIAVMAIETEEHLRAGTLARNSVAQTGQATSDAIEANIGYRDSVRSMEVQNPSRVLRGACKQLGDALDEVITVLEQYEKRAAELVRLFDQKLEKLAA